ncbi:CapA family protein [Clostridia bacterium]|nr:CapA family protein [Clostridia bacterium]
MITIYLLLGFLMLGIYPSPIDAPLMQTKKIYTPASLSHMVLTEDLRISFIGDIMMHDTQITGAYQGEGVYDFSESFAYVKPYIQESDFVIANLETTFAGAKAGYSGYPRFNAPDELATNLADIGIDLLVHCNNHVLDTGFNGLVRTKKTIEGAGMMSAGTRLTQDADTVVYFSVQNTDFALITGTYGTNGLTLPTDKKYMLNVLDPVRLVEDIKKATQKADYVICFLHFGTEYEEHPNRAQIALAETLVDAGADAIIGSHPHVIQTDGFIDNNIVVYSLGNFISAQRGAKRRTGMIYSLNLEKNLTDGNVRLKNTEYFPVFTYRAADGKRPYYLGPLSDNLEENSETHFQKSDFALVEEGLSYLEQTNLFADNAAQ